MSTREGKDICEFAHDGFVYKSSYDLKMYTCEHLHVNKEVLSMSACKGTDICELHTVGLHSKATVI